MARTKRGEHTWNPSAIRYSRHAVSNERPIRSGIHVHTARSVSKFDMHWELEFGVVLSGTMQREYEQWKDNLHPGDVWFCGMWEPHGWKVVRAPCEVLVLVILPQMLVNMRCEEAPDFNWLRAFTVPPGARPRTPPGVRANVMELARRFEGLGAWAPAQQELWKRLLLMEILLLLQREWRPGPSDSLQSGYTRINRSVELVFASRRHVSAQDAAKECGMTRNYFNGLFEQLMGLSFARFALRYRLTQAASALLLSERPVKSIAAEWGFTDASHLHHCFMRHYGCSPKAYRRRQAVSEGN